MTDIFCPMIHGGLDINLKSDNSELTYNQCYLSTTQLVVPNNAQVNWKNTFPEVAEFYRRYL